MDLPEIPIGDAMDWTPEQCLEAALQQIKWMRVNYPEGLEGIAVLFKYTIEFETSKAPLRFYINSGLDSMDFVSLCERAKYIRLSTTYTCSE
jgi:hypothetical protein